MILNIDDNRMVSYLQEKFNECFPFLKLEFYDMKHKWQEGSSEQNKVREDKKIGDIRKNHNSGIFDIKSWYKAGRVEQEFRNTFGLYAQIFFLKNGTWIESISADDLTLSALNQIGADEARNIETELKQ